MHLRGTAGRRRTHEVGGLQVAVDDVVAVQEAQATQELEQKVLQVRVAQRLRRLDDLVQVRVVQLHHDVARVLLHVQHNVPEGDHVGVLAQPPHQPQLAQRVLAVRL
jgi:hypothetical protein